MLMDGFIIHSGLSCTVLSSDGAQLPALWLVPKIDLSVRANYPSPRGMYKQVHMTENVACSKAVEKSRKLKTRTSCLQVMFVNICLFF